MSDFEISFKGFIESMLGGVAKALELLEKHNTTHDITEKVEGILFMRLELSLSFVLGFSKSKSSLSF